MDLDETWNTLYKEYLIPGIQYNTKQYLIPGKPGHGAHLQKIEEIVKGIPPKGAKTSFVVAQPGMPFGHLSCTNFDHFSNIRRESVSTEKFLLDGSTSK